MNKILVVTLGGTICSSVKEGSVIKLNDAADRKLIAKANPGFDVFFLSPVFYSSENADAALYKQALAGIIEAFNEHKPDGILILHGTDSMAYFAQLAVRVLSYLNVPVIITGSKLPADLPASDALSNLKYSFGLLGAAIEGKLGSITFGVVYTEDYMNETLFIPANRVMSADFNGDYGKFPGKPQVKTLSEKEAAEFLSEEDKTLLVIPAVPGFPAEKINTEDIDGILIEAFHSGTQAGERLGGLLGRAKQAGVKCFLAPCHKGNRQYESFVTLKDKGVTPIYDMPLEGAWAEALISL